MLLCAEMFLNCSILQANGMESQKGLHAVRATSNMLLMTATKEEKERERATFSCGVVINFLPVLSTKGLVKNSTALWLSVAVTCPVCSITLTQPCLGTVAPQCNNTPRVQEP